MAVCCLCSGPVLSASRPAEVAVLCDSRVSNFTSSAAFRRNHQLVDSKLAVCSSFSEVFGAGTASELRCKGGRTIPETRHRSLNVAPIVGALAPELNDPRLLVEAPSILGLVKGAESTALPSFRWRRVLLKVSGEALAGDGSSNIDPKVSMSIAREVAAITRLGVEVAIVVGGGNFFRGASWVGASGLDRASADHIGCTLFLYSP
ncbi:hypothetical protein R1sor_023535 [Riccia sorocarpa]|uniref:UMP kinase n=1 Tax=Riccia sorocarpa TaxID=122646 RepID=A0ABD3GQ63_9MARC